MSDFVSKYGPWAVIAGASEGIGEAFAERLAHRGLNLVLMARREVQLNAVASRLNREFGVEVRSVVADLSDPQIESVFGEAIRRIDVGMLVYNAAHVPVGRFVDVELDSLLQAVDVNVRAPVMLTRILLPSLCERESGAIVLMSSMSSLQGLARIATYAATKSFNTILAEGIWYELRDMENIDVVSCVSGAVPTPGYRRAFKKDAPGMLEPAFVAESTLESLGKGPRFVPGAVNRLVSQVFTRLMPRKLAIKIISNSSKDLM